MNVLDKVYQTIQSGSVVLTPDLATVLSDLIMSEGVDDIEKFTELQELFKEADKMSDPTNIMNLLSSTVSSCSIVAYAEQADLYRDKKSLHFYVDSESVHVVPFQNCEIFKAYSPLVMLFFQKFYPDLNVSKVRQGSYLRAKDNQLQHLTPKEVDNFYGIQ